jgi:putative NADH-flavin reductase
MKVLILGAGGKTGKLVVEKALASGHDVTVLIHTPQDDKKHEPVFPSKVTVFHGDVRNPTKLDQAMQFQQAVIDTIGGKKPFLNTDLETSAVKVVIDVMKRNEVKRLIVVSALGEGNSKAQTGFFYEHLLMPVFLRGIIPDKANMESEVEESGLDFIIVRPSILTDSEDTGKTHIAPPGELAHKISRAGLAQFLADQLSSDQHLGQAVTLTDQ